MPRIRLAGEFRKVGTGTKADLFFCRLPVRPQGRSDSTHTVPVAESSGQNFRNTVTTGLSGPAVHVPNRFANSHRVHLGRLHMRPIQWHLKNNWRVPESLEKVIPIPGATRPVQGPDTSDVATQPLQAPGAELATQPLQAPGAGTATQPPPAPGAGPEVLPTGIESTQLNKPLPGVRPDEFAGESDSEAEVDGESASPASVHVQGDLPEDATDQDLSEDANYRETIRGVRSFMGWHQIPDYDHSSSSLNDNPFAGSRTKPAGQVSVRLPVDEWLCRKFERLNVTVAEGYPSRNSETGGLLRDQFVKTPRSSKWYAMHTDKKDSASAAVCDWSPEPAKLNSTFTRVARRSLPSAPASRTFS